MTRPDDSPIPDYPAQLRLDGRRFVVLGAGQGIGRQTAHALAAVGARRRLRRPRRRIWRATSPARSTASPCVGDMTQRADAERIFAEASGALGGLDGVVDIIGMSRYVAARRPRPTRNGTGTSTSCCATRTSPSSSAGACWPRAAAGTMVFVASVSGITSAPRHAAYGAAKAGPHVARAHGRGRARAERRAGERGGARRGVDATGLRVPRRGGPRAERRQHAAATDRARPPTSRRRSCSWRRTSSAFVTGQTLVVDGGVGAKFPYPMAEADVRGTPCT